MLNINVVNAETIRWVTESWESFTNEDGSGLYNEIVRAAFDGHQVEIINMPWKRSLLEVKNGTADMTGATNFINGYITPRYPMLASPVSILFYSDKINFTDLPSLTNYVGVWASPYEEELFLGIDKALFSGFSVQERETAYKMLVSGRADYFLDAKPLHQAWLENQKLQSKGTIRASDYELKDIRRLNLFMIFSDNARGKQLKDIFDKGMAKLRQKGQLRNIYAKYHFLEQMPPDFGK
jgi:ABC-type amino acid transport substrate-binding protein